MPPVLSAVPRADLVQLAAHAPLCLTPRPLLAFRVSTLKTGAKGDQDEPVSWLLEHVNKLHTSFGTALQEENSSRGAILLHALDGALSRASVAVDLEKRVEDGPGWDGQI